MIQKIVIGVIGLVLVGAAAGYYLYGDSLPTIGEKPLNSASFICDREKTIKADFYEKKVALTLSDSRTLTLPQTISASGARYATENESLVFWNKGDTAFITEGSQGETYSNCEIEVPGQEPRSSYASSTMGISIKYPKSYTLSADYQYLGFPKKPINGVKVLIPATMATGTNLSNFDTGVSVEQLPRAQSCTGDIFVVDNVKATSVTENGVSYSVATTSGAGAGNLYEEMVYAVSGSKPCTAVRYFIHSTNIGNFEPGVVREFDRTALLAAFDKIRASLVLTSTSTTQ